MKYNSTENAVDGRVYKSPLVDYTHPLTTCGDGRLWSRLPRMMSEHWPSQRSTWVTTLLGDISQTCGDTSCLFAHCSFLHAPGLSCHDPQEPPWVYMTIYSKELHAEHEQRLLGGRRTHQQCLSISMSCPCLSRVRCFPCFLRPQATPGRNQQNGEKPPAWRFARQKW